MSSCIVQVLRLQYFYFIWFQILVWLIFFFILLFLILLWLWNNLYDRTYKKHNKIFFFLWFVCVCIYYVWCTIKSNNLMWKIFIIKHGWFMDTTQLIDDINSVKITAPFYNPFCLLFPYIFLFNVFTLSSLQWSVYFQRKYKH